MLGLLVGPVGKILGIGALIVALFVAGGILVHAHDNKVRAVMQASADRAIAEAQEQARAHEVAALQAQAKDDAARAASSQDLWKKTHVYASSQACIKSPAVRALLDGLRSPANGPRATN